MNRDERVPDGFSDEEVERCRRMSRLMLTDARDKAVRLLGEYEEHPDPPDRLITDLAVAADAFHFQMHPHLYDGPAGEFGDGKRHKEVLEKMDQLDQPLVEDPNISAEEFAELIREVEQEFHELGFGRLLSA